MTIRIDMDRPGMWIAESDGDLIAGSDSVIELQSTMKQAFPEATVELSPSATAFALCEVPAHMV
jgi:hypothetical protein